ncbi:MAG: hypothetical protein COW65_01445 [Cytophagales bacterium CG18_big_fil_WC_8_21_14_2_50_42_9]|nr:MAG: hypothetical protein COW65_01445 [Cytophagales bacterium CG18_big_fil_WC_8_21_14_2_50_42_9]
MRKALPLIIMGIILFFPFLLQAQEQEKKPAFVPALNIGVKGGTSFSQLNFNPTIDQTFTRGILGGVVFQYIDHANVGIQIELNYVQKGWTEQLDTITTYRRSLNYLELPFMTHVTLGKNNSNFIINFGPAVSYLLSNTDSINLINESDTLRYYQKSINNKIDFGLTLGIGFAKKTVIGIFELEGRFTYGFNNIINKSQGLTVASNQNITVSLSYLIPFRRKED